MQQNLEKEVARFRQMTVIELRARYAELFGEPTGVTNKGWLCKRLAWRLQALTEGAAVCHDMLQFSARVLAILANLDW
jgi:hypothetical protein